jgi:hypothetical protein
VLTGGPGGGKTTLMRELRAEDPDARRWLMAAEAAPLLFQAGLRADARGFQAAVVRLQAALEDAVLGSAAAGRVLVCHRGTLDALAYWLRGGRDADDFFGLLRTSRAAQLRRYDAVLDLETAALGVARHYRRWPEAHRPEDVALAAETDRLCRRAWEGHPRYALITNDYPDWPAKARAAREALDRLLDR